jgi:hypothetical protein
VTRSAVERTCQRDRRWISTKSRLRQDMLGTSGKRVDGWAGYKMHASHAASNEWATIVRVLQQRPSNAGAVRGYYCALSSIRKT